MRPDVRKIVLQALAAGLPAAEAARRAGVSRQGVYKASKGDPALRAALTARAARPAAPAPAPGVGPVPAPSPGPAAHVPASPVGGGPAVEVPAPGPAGGEVEAEDDGLDLALLLSMSARALARTVADPATDDGARVQAAATLLDTLQALRGIGMNTTNINGRVT